MNNTPSAEGATTPETLRQKGLFGLREPLEKARCALRLTDGVNLSGIKDRGGPEYIGGLCLERTRHFIKDPALAIARR